MNRRTALIVVFVGIAVLLFDLYIFHPFKNGNGTFTLKEGEMQVLSWYLGKGDFSVGTVRVSGGNEEVRFYAKNPLGEYVSFWGFEGPIIVKTRTDCDFTATQDGIYSFYFENLDPADKIVNADFRSPYEPKLRQLYRVLIFYGAIGIAAILILCGISELVGTWRKTIVEWKIEEDLMMSVTWEKTLQGYFSYQKAEG